MQSFKNPFPNINLKSISTKEIENVIKSLKPKNSSGCDGISTKLIKILGGSGYVKTTVFVSYLLG